MFCSWFRSLSGYLEAVRWFCSGFRSGNEGRFGLKPWVKLTPVGRFLFCTGFPSGSIRPRVTGEAKSKEWRDTFSHLITSSHVPYRFFLAKEHNINIIVKKNLNVMAYSNIHKEKIILLPPWRDICLVGDSLHNQFSMRNLFNLKNDY